MISLLTCIIIIDGNDYYPYGTKITQPTTSATAYPQITANRWRYAGKEEQSAVTGTSFLD